MTDSLGLFGSVGFQWKLSETYTASCRGKHTYIIGRS
jgi:hypothetical protein